MKDIIGVIHLPLDSYNIKLDELEKNLIDNLNHYNIAGMKKVIIQDQTIERKASVDTIIRVSALCYTARKAFPHLKLGLILDSNDCEAAIKIGLNLELDFIRIKVFIGAMLKNTGIVEGCILDNYKLVNEAKKHMEILTDIYDKTGTPLGDISYMEACKYALKMGADKLIVTGKNLTQTKEILNDLLPDLNNLIYVGGGINKNNIHEINGLAYGCIVSSSLMDSEKENIWDTGKIREIVNIYNHLSE